MMQPFVNPNYFNQQPYQPSYQPYTPSYQPMQSNIQSNTPNTLSNALNTLGKVVDSIDVVRATEIPMDGSIYYFPKADGSIVYSKQWLPNGTTKIGSFLPQNDVLDQKANNYALNDFESVLAPITNEIRALQDDVQTLIDNLKPQTRSRKAVANESNADN